MRRRSLLVTAGTVLTSGCSSILPAPETTVEETTAANETDGPPTEGVPTGTATDRPTTTDAATEPDPGTPTTPQRTVAAAIKTARTDLSEAYSKYVDFAEGEDPGFLEVDAATTVQISAITNQTADATNALTELPAGKTDEQKQTIRQLRGVATLLGRGIQAQWNLKQAYDTVIFTKGRIYAESHTRVPNQVDELRARLSGATGYLETIRTDTTRSDAAALDALSPTVYDEKLAQFDQELTVVETLADALESFSDGLSVFAEGVDPYINDEWRTAEEKFSASTEDLGSANGAIAALSKPSSFDAVLTELETVTGAVVAGAEDLATAAEAARKYEWDRKDDHYSRAVDHFEGSDIVANDIDSIGRIIRYG